jgi:Ras-related protein Rap-2C
MYDLSNEASFEEAKTIIKDIVTMKKDKKTPIILLGNKLDLDPEREVLRTSGNMKIQAYLFL